MKTNSFFTLVELLMVVAVIAILLCIIMPSTTQVKGKSIKSSCLNNLRQIGMGLNMYADDHNDLYPRCTMRPSDPPKAEIKLPGIAPTLRPYLKDPQIFLCPGDNNEVFFRNEGSSYEWKSSIYNGWKASRKTAIPNTIPAQPKVPVMYDYDNFHGKPDSKTAKNWLYPFGNVAGEPLQ